MPGAGQPDPEDMFPASEDDQFAAGEGALAAGDEAFAAEDGSLTAEEVAALAAVDRAEDDWWPLVTGSALPRKLGTPAESGGPGELGGLAGGGCGEGFAEGGMLDQAAPSVMLAGLAEEAYQQRGSLDDDRVGGLARAYRRLAAQAQARELALIAELARRRPQPGTPAAEDGGLPEQVSEFLADEVAVLLTLTSRAANGQVGLALGLAAHWRIAAALEAGRIDVPKALVLLDMLEPASEATAAAVEAVLLPIASGLTTAQLRAWVTRLLLDLDPAAARRRRETALRQAHVACWNDPEGTATLAGRYLPPAQVLAADRRLCAIATAWKKQGAVAGMDLLRAHAYLALLLGHDTTTPPPSLLIPEQPLAPEQPPVPRQTSAPDQTSDPEQAPSPEQPPDPDQASSPEPEPEPGPATAGGGGPVFPPPLWLTGTVNLTVPLETLLGLADRPGEVVGFGPLHADTARELATSMSAHRATRWNVIITDPSGRAMSFGGPARARRTRKAAARGDPASLGLARGSPAATSAGGSPTLFGAAGWTITVATEAIAPHY